MALILDSGVLNVLVGILNSNIQKSRISIPALAIRVNQNFQCMMMDENILGAWCTLVRVTEEGKYPGALHLACFSSHVRYTGG